jgi:serine protease Do
MLDVGLNDNHKRQGSGVLIDDKKILTCYHVILGGINFKAYYDDDTTQILNLLRTSKAVDSAILTTSANAVKPVRIGDSDMIKKGDTLYVVSSPMRQKNVVTIGEVVNSGVTTTYKIFVFVATNRVAPGSSGGPCFNKNGELIGMVVSMTKTGQCCIAPINNVRKALAS